MRRVLLLTIPAILAFVACSTPDVRQWKPVAERSWAHARAPRPIAGPAVARSAPAPVAAPAPSAGPAAYGPASRAPIARPVAPPAPEPAAAATEPPPAPAAAPTPPTPPAPAVAEVPTAPTEPSVAEVPPAAAPVPEPEPASTAAAEPTPAAPAPEPPAAAEPAPAPEPEPAPAAVSEPEPAPAPAAAPQPEPAPSVPTEPAPAPAAEPVPEAARLTTMNPATPPAFVPPAQEPAPPPAPAAPAQPSAVESAAAAVVDPTQPAGDGTPWQPSWRKARPAESAAAPAGPREWTFEFEPSLWIFDVDGDVGSNGTRVPVGATLSDGFSLAGDSADLGFSGRLEARNGKLGIFLDGGLFQNEVDADPDAGGPDADTDFRLGLWEAGAAWTIWEPLEADGRVATVDLLGGARWNDLAVDIDGLTGSDRVDTDWFDPFLGVRARIPLGQGVDLRLRADGGGGIGSGSNLAWNLSGGFDWWVSDCVAVTIGYRWYTFERDYRDRDVDIQLSGPGLGVVVRF